jgi:homoserine kinase type II
VCPVARIHKTRAGQTYFRRLESPGDEYGVFYAIFDFLPGDDRYTWVGPHCLEGELTNAAVMLARFHAAVASLQPRGRRTEPKIIELLPLITSQRTPSSMLACLKDLNRCSAISPRPWRN